MTLFLTLLSGIAWTVVYVALIHSGFKQETYGMPLFALGLNIAWEFIYALNELVIHPTSNEVQGIVNLVWACCDLVIVYTYFKYGKQYFPKKAQNYFGMYSILVFSCCFAIQLAFYLSFAPLDAAKYSAFLQNVAMSVLFINMLFQRNQTEGQSLLVGFAKWIGTLAPTILMGVIQGPNIYIIICGVICSIFDILYIVFLSKRKQEEKQFYVRKDG